MVVRFCLMHCMIAVAMVFYKQVRQDVSAVGIKSRTNISQYCHAICYPGNVQIGLIAPNSFCFLHSTY